MKINLKVIIITIISVGLIVGYYYYLSNKTASTVENSTNLTEVQKVITEDMDKSYPSTPREVVKFYNRILCCYYNEAYDDDEFVSLAEQARKLLDDELLGINPEDVFLTQLKADVASYKEDGKTISNTALSDSKDVVYKTIEGRECAYVQATYFIKEGSSFMRTNEKYILRKDDTGKWKILAFYIEDGDNTEQ